MIYSEKVENFHPNTCMGTRMLDLTILLSSVSSSISIQSHCCTQSISILRTQQQQNIIQGDTKEQYTGWHRRTIYRGLRSNENKTIQRVIQKNNIQDDTEEQHTGGWEELQHRTSHYWQESLANAKVARDSLARQRRILTWNWHSRSF